MKHNVGVEGAVAMGVIFIATKVFLAFPRTMAELGAQAAWLIVLVACLLAPLSWWGMAGVLRQSPGKSLIAATEAALGPVLGSTVNLVYFAFFFFTTFIVLRQFAANIVGTVMPKTPLQVAILTLLLAIVYIAYLGMEAICRVCWLFGPFMLVGLLVLLAGGLYTHTHLYALTPIWGTGIAEVIGWGVAKTSLLGELLIFGLIAPAFRQKQDLARAVWWTMLLSTVVLTACVVAYLFMFPYPTATRIGFPLLEVSRGIIAGRWFQRVEAVFLIIWVFSAVLKLSVGLYGAADTLAQVLHVPNFRHLLLPLALITYSLTLVPTNLPEAVTWDAQVLRNYGWIASILLPWMTWGVSLVRAKRSG